MDFLCENYSNREMVLQLLYKHNTLCLFHVIIYSFIFLFIGYVTDIISKKRPIYFTELHTL